jgi:molybdopterin converting factor small subunit
MAIRVEFYGIARQRAGVAEVDVPLCGPEMPLGELLSEVGRRFPALAAECLAGNRPRAGYVVNIGGDRFASHPATALADGQSLLFLSADGGG